MSDVLVVAEHRRGDLRDVSFELIAAGRELASATGGDLAVTIIGGNVDEFATELNRAGVDEIHTVAHGTEFNHDISVQAVTALFDALDPSYILMAHSVNGLDYAPAVASRLDLPLVTDVTGFDLDGTITATREMYGSKVETTVDISTDCAAFTLRGGEWEPAENEGDATIETADVEIDSDAVRSTVTGFEEAGSGDIDIAEAEFIVSIGRGIEEEDNLPLIEELTDALGATLASSRPIVDAGWLPKNRQVGQSGKVVTPTIYLAIGISGAVQHVAGMKGSETIIAVNTDPNAPIFDIADYGIVGDLFDVVPALIEEFE